MEFNGKKIEITATDGLEITGDLYMSEDRDNPLILLFHQAGFSRGEYRPIAPRLNKMGFNCLAIDLRSGNEVNNVINETKKRADEQNKGTEYRDALCDVESSFLYAGNELGFKDIFIWGSSYSASLTLYMGSKYSDLIKGILAFSPGEYFEINNKKIEYYSSKISCPVYITSAKKEKKMWISIYNGIQSERFSYVPKKKSIHGSRALWADTKGHEEHWQAVEDFLTNMSD